MSEETVDQNNLKEKTQAVVDDHAKLTLFVRGLPFNATNEDLEEFFGEIGPVRKCFVVTERKEGEKDESKPFRNKGFGYVHYAMEEDAKTALTKLKTVKFKGRKIKIELAKRKSDSAQDDSKKKKAQVTEEIVAEPKEKVEPKEKAEPAAFEVNARLIIRNLPWKYREADLNRICVPYGKVMSVNLPRKYEGGPLRGFAFVQYEKVAEAKAAMEALNATEHHGRTIAVDWSIPKKRYDESEAKETDQSAISNEDVEMKEKDENEEEDNDDSDNDSQSASDSDDGDSSSDNDSSDDDDNSDEDDNSDDDENSDDEDSDDEEETKADTEDKKDAKKKGPAPSEGRTLFIRNLLFESTEADLRELFKQWGQVVYAKITRDPVTGLSRGTGFVCMKKAEDANECLKAANALRNLSQKDENNDSEAMKQLLSKREKKKKGLMFKSIITPESTTGDGSKFTLHGRVLDVTLAVDRNQAKQIKDDNQSQKRKEDKRNLYLMREGVVFPGTPAAETMSESELAKRQMSFSSRKKLISNNPALFISKTRLSIRNLPIHVDDKELKALGISSVQKFKNEVKGNKRTDLTKEEKEDGWHFLPRIRQAKIIRSKDRMEVATNQLRSKGYGFLEFYTHAHALSSLRYLNNNPDIFKGKRLIVEFSLENKDVVNRRDARSTDNNKKDDKKTGFKRGRDNDKNDKRSAKKIRKEGNRQNERPGRAGRK